MENCMTRTQTVGTLLLVLGLGLAGSGSGQVVVGGRLNKGMLAFDGHGTLGDFTGTTSSVTGEMTSTPTLVTARGWVEAPAKSLVTGSGKRDRDMYGSLEVEKFPVIRFDLDSVAAGVSQGDSTAVTLHGRFTIHGKTLADTIPGWLWRSNGGSRFRGRTPMDVRRYDIGGLSKMLGLLKMNPNLIVRMDVEFSKN